MTILTRPTGEVILTPHVAFGLPFVIALLGLALNHSARNFGVNISLADALILIVFVAAVLLRPAVRVPIYVMIFFLLLVASSITTAFLITPGVFGTDSNPGQILLDLAKLTVSFIYLLSGFGVASLGLERTAVRWFAIGGVVVALIGILNSALGAGILSDLMYYSGIRFKGFMADPNYFAVLSCAAMVYFLRSPEIKLALRVGALLLLGASVFLSGSKTGLVTLVAVLMLSLLSWLVRSARSPGRLVLAYTLVAGLALASSLLLGFLFGLLKTLSAELPQLQRIVLLLEDPADAISGGGSTRAETWESAISIIQTSPLTGVGIGSYVDANKVLFGETALAHNTYLQLAAEWGLPLALGFFAWLAFVLVAATLQERRSSSKDLILMRDMIIVFLIGSASLSLNNARMFWLFLGILLFLLAAARSDQSADGLLGSAGLKKALRRAGGIT